ncbi:hypothetical protein [Corynebacterium sp. NML180780]|uniref:hypothetical protein n=1 Tax=Corynebacterium sp. NML180780 TaxID=2598459 RepID=UPI0011910425|nr:hypothetical protein [Corynebacterium sp. NML180780]TVX82599.1 hypothetical protein FPP74_00980 [Corynebacterium sp. NML180780]
MSEVSSTPAAKGPRPFAGLAKSVAADLGTRTNATLAALLAVVGITGVSGGLEAAPPEGLTVAAAPRGTGALAQPAEFTAAPFEISVRRTYTLGDARVVEMRLTNTASRPVPAPQFLMAFALEDSHLGPEEQPDMRAAVVRKHSAEALTEVAPSEAISPNPGVPLDVALIFQGPSGTNAAEADTLVITSLEYRTSFLDGAKAWLTKDCAAEVSLR